MSAKKRFLAVTLLASLAASSAFANNNNTGQIEVQGVVPGLWELTVQDINDGYDFDLSDATVTSARVGTIHVYTNDATNTTTLGHLRIESANSGRLINSEAIPSISSDNQQYTLTLTQNALASSTITTSTLPSNHDLVVPATVDFTATNSGASEEETYDVTITLGSDRPEASGVHTDTITFTIMDDA